ncbi:glycerol kinase GlpK [Bryobacter aggregatus]|uniref:glycerol kinase GlpK n=1 Tax=Bryobacter aggregatus TaxID=360054 RepID=UPI0004E1398F|nr:glycerol kinase GlpK [Bryobacter aggregatus]
MPYLLSLDEGTTSARAALYDDRAQRRAIHAVPFQLSYPKPGWVEVDAEVVWGAQLAAARRVLDAAKLSVRELLAVGITNQRETTVVWEKATGRPVAPAIVWQCRRTASYCEALARGADREYIEKQTGLVIDAYFSGSKLRWILDHIPDGQARAANGELLFGTIDTWLIWKLSGGKVHVTDATNASRTMLMDLEGGNWDDKLLRIFDIPKLMLPRIVSSSEVVGVTTPEMFGVEIPIAGIAGDQQAALFGQACFRSGLVKNTYGTGCFALMHTGETRPVSANRLLATRAASGATANFAIEGSVFVAGAAMQFLRDNLGFFGDVKVTEELARSVPHTDGVYMVPAFTGLGAPYWDPEVRGSITGLTRSTSRAHITRAALESIAYQSYDLMEAMHGDTGQAPKELRVDGGAAANDFLMQFQADLLDCPVVRPVDIESTALGAAYLAGLGVGHFHGTTELESFWGIEKRFEPNMPASQRDSLLAGWKHAVVKTRS